MSQPYSPRPPATSHATPNPPAAGSGANPVRLLPAAVWAALTLGALVFVLVFGADSPYADEWEFVPALLGQEPVGPWLWAQHNEHRLPLPRAVYLALFKVTGTFRAGMLVQVAALSALSLGLMRLAARLRGRPDWPDAFFPVSLLHLGHWENLLMGYQICFVFFALLAAGLVVVALGTTRENAYPSGVRAGVLLFLLALTGGSGLAVVPPVAAWIAYLAVIVWRAGHTRRALVLVGLAVLPVAYIAVYFAGYQRPPGHPPPSRDLVAVAETAGVILALAFGVGLSGVWWAVAVAEVALGAATVALLVRRGPGDRPSSAGLIAVAAGLFGLALAVGMARAEWGTEIVRLWSRYSMLTWPLLAAAYLAWVRAGRKWVPAALCAVAALGFPTNTGTGMVVGAGHRAAMTSLEADVQRGEPAEVLAARYFAGGQEERARRGIPMLRAARVGIYSGR